MSPGNYVASLPEVPQGGQVVGWGGGRPLLHRLLFLSSGRLQEVSCLVAFLVGRKLTRLSNQWRRWLYWSRVQRRPEEFAQGSSGLF